MITPMRIQSPEKISNLRTFLEMDKLRFSAYLKSTFRHELSLGHFNKIALIGVGSSGRVYLMQEKSTTFYYAIKELEKRKLVEQNLLKHIKYEKKILQSVNFPFVIRLHYFFTDNSYIYFVTPFLIGGDMYRLLTLKTHFDETLSCFYAAQLLLAVEYLHYMNVVHRDLKLENIMIDEIGYIKLTDFGYSKIVKGRTYTVCGTPDYIAPEIILQKGYGLSVDWWSFGVFIYELNYGTPPFQHLDNVLLYENIVAGIYKIPPKFSQSLLDLVKKLIEVDVSKRFGNLKNGVDDIKNHKWFKHIVWLNILNRVVEAPYKPNFKGPDDISNFDTFYDVIHIVADKDEFAEEFKYF